MADQQARFTGSEVRLRHPDDLYGNAAVAGGGNEDKLTSGWVKKGGAGHHALSGMQFSDERVSRFADAVPGTGKAKPQSVDARVHQDERPASKPEYADGRYDGPDVQVPGIETPQIPDARPDMDRAVRTGAERMLGGYPGGIAGPERRDPYEGVYGRISKPTGVSSPVPGQRMSTQFDALQKPASPPVAAPRLPATEPGAFHATPQVRPVRPVEGDVIDLSHIQPGDELGIHRSVREFMERNRQEYGTPYRPAPGEVLGGQFGPQTGPVGEDTGEDAV